MTEYMLLPSDVSAVAASDMSAGAPAFIHLRTHSAYSLLEGALQIGKIIGHAKDDNAPAIAVTDTNNLFGALEFAQKASKDGIQPIIGCVVDIAFGDHQPEGRTINRRDALDLAPVVLLASSEEGYANMVRLVSRSYLETESGDPVHIRADWLPDLSEDVIFLTGGAEGPIGKPLSAEREERARSRLEFLKNTFGDRLYIELHRQRGYDRVLEARLVDLAYEIGRAHV